MSENKEDPEHLSQKEDSEPNNIQILEFAYETLKQYTYQSVISTFEDLISTQLTEENPSKLSFEILSKGEGDGAPTFSLSLEDPAMKEKLSELVLQLRNLPNIEITDKEDWQMMVEIPFGTDNEHLDILLNTDHVF